ncbi:MAG: type VI secretion system protein TssA [Rickettsiales bacterium]|nr:type VI secretion system protein TssA [Rickettsiales bacterium]|tara:strand:- start:17016 stop:18143 length:1128 start_codon:yes stop_codon:yes gene_type:complete
MSNAQLPLEDFLKPIAKDDPSGPSLRYENIYDDIREAMRSEDPNLPQGVWQRKIKQPDWKTAEKLCTDALIKQSKDLQIAAWLIECLIHNKDINTITQGFQLFHDLTVKFWDTVHPQIPEDGDIDFRLSPFIWLNEKLSMQLNEIKINAKTMVGATLYTFNTWIELTRNRDLYQVEDRPEDPEVIDQVGSTNNPTILDLQNNIDKTPIDFYQNLKEQCEAINDICLSIEEFLDQKFKDESLTLFKIKKVLKDIITFCGEILHKRTEQNVTAERDDGHETEEAGYDIPQAPEQDTPSSIPSVKSINQSSAGNPANSREQAYENILKSADFLEKLEPHSPVPFLIKKAAALRNKNFVEVMKELNSNGALANLWDDDK